MENPVYPTPKQLKALIQRDLNIVEARASVLKRRLECEHEMHHYTTRTVSEGQEGPEKMNIVCRICGLIWMWGGKTL